jgi:hypothetical protein
VIAIERLSVKIILDLELRPAGYANFDGVRAPVTKSFDVL